MHDAVNKILAQPREISHCPRRRMVCSFCLHISPSKMDLVSPWKKKNSISGTNEALEGRSGCSFIKCLRKNRPGLPAAAQILAGPVAWPLQLEGKGDCGHWCMSVMEQQKTFLWAWTNSHSPSAPWCCREAAESDRCAQHVQWDQLWSLMQWVN